MIGNKIGKRELETAQQYAKKFTFLSVLLGITLGIFLAAIASFIPSAFKVSSEIKRTVMIILFINAAFFPLESLNLHYVIGVLRGGGDTTFAFLLDIIITLGVGIPLAFFTGLVLHKTIFLLMILLGIEEVIKAVIGLLRMISKKWINNLTEG